MRNKTTLAISERLEDRRMLDGSGEFVSDVNLSAPGNWWLEDRPEFASVWFREELYFAADGGNGDVELWKSDGTEVGTRRVADIRSGQMGSFPEHLVAATDRVFFTAYQEDFGRQIWSTDGTEEGTQPISSFSNQALSEDYLNYQKLVTDDRLYFTWNTPEYGNEIWVSDGTQEGTNLLLDSKPGREGNWAYDLREINGRVLITSEQGLWASDGTPAGTRELRIPGVVFPSFAAQTEDYMFFFAGSFGDRSFWATDGTAEGTAKLLSEVEFGRVSVVENEVFLHYNIIDRVGTVGAPATSVLIRSDGTVEGTERIEFEGFSYEGQATTDRYFLVVNQSVVTAPSSYSIVDAGQLWWIGPGQSELTRVAGIPKVVDELVASATSVYFRSADGEVIRVSEDGAGPIDMVEVGDRELLNLSSASTSDSGTTLLWAAYSNEHVLWSIDEPQNQASIVADSLLRPSQDGLRDDYFQAQMIAVGDRIFVETVDQNHQHRLVTTDGTSGGEMLPALPPLQFSIDDSHAYRFPIGDLTVVGPNLYAIAGDDESEPQLWVTNGNNRDTFPIGANSGDDLSGISDLTGVGDRLFFIAETSTAGTGLWVTDGTSTSASLVSGDLEVHRGSRVPTQDLFDAAESRPVGIGSFAFFVAKVNGALELWKSDGTVTQKVVGIPGPPLILPISGGAFMIFESEVWFTDGTTSGTHPIDFPRTALLDSASTVGDQLLLVDGERVVAVDASGTALELARVEAERHSVPGGFFDGKYFTSTGSHAYFMVDAGVASELWVTDGSDENTILVRSFPEHGISQFSATKEFLYFSGTDEYGRELWRSDGTADGTTRLTDINPGTTNYGYSRGSSDPVGMTPSEYYVYFAADDGFHGWELYRIAVADPPQVIGDADGNGRVEFADFLALSANFGKEVDAVWAEVDFDGNGSVNFVDFLLLSQNFGKLEP